MKYIYFTIIIVATTLTSCVVESYQKPSRTIVGYNISKPVVSDILTASSTADIARIVDMWRSATTEQEKFDIEDKYFGNYTKLRQYGDKITIVGYYDFQTFNKPLAESNWRVTPLNVETKYNVTYEVSLTGINEYLINILNSSNELLGGLTLKVITPDKAYSILGNSTIAPIFTTTHYDKIAYSIATPVTFIFNSSEQLIWRWSPYQRQQDGSVDIKIYKSGAELKEGKTIVEYAPQGVNVSYRGFTDFYTYSEYKYE